MYPFWVKKLTLFMILRLTRSTGPTQEDSLRIPYRVLFKTSSAVVGQRSDGFLPDFGDLVYLIPLLGDY